MEQVGVGITGIGLRAFSSADILTNDLNCNLAGVYFSDNSFPDHLLVSNNFITIGQNVAGVNPGANGIIIDNYSSSSNFNITGNNLYLENAEGGIVINGDASGRIAYNEIHLNDQTVNNYGIKTMNSRSCETSCNFVYGSSSDQSSRQRNYLTVESQGMTINCNYSLNGLHGFEFDGFCDNSLFATNIMLGNHWEGLHVNTNGVMGRQEDRGNFWDCSTFGSGHEAVNNNISNLPSSRFDVNPAEGCSFAPPNPDPPGGWYQYSGNNHENNCSCNWNPEEGMAPLDLVDYRIATDSMLFAEWNAETRWAARRYLYGKLQQMPSYTLDSVMQNFFTIMEQSNTADLDVIKNAAAQVINIPVSARQQISANVLANKNYMSQLHANNLLIAAGATGSELQNMASQNTLLKDSIAQIKNYYQSVLLPVYTAQVSEADVLKEQNNNIEAIGVVEANEKTVNGIYFSTVAKRDFDFTPAQASTLLSIASQCPFAGGSGVYKARALYRLINHAMQFDDVYNCGQLGYLRLANEGTNESGSINSFIRPNPSNQLATLFFNVPLQQNSSLVIYSSGIQEMNEIKLTKNTPYYEINTGRLSNGLYLYTVVSEGSVIAKGKFTVMH